VVAGLSEAAPVEAADLFAGVVVEVDRFGDGPAERVAPAPEGARSGLAARRAGSLPDAGLRGGSAPGARAGWVGVDSLRADSLRVDSLRADRPLGAAAAGDWVELGWAVVDSIPLLAGDHF